MESSTWTPRCTCRSISRPRPSPGRLIQPRRKRVTREGAKAGQSVKYGYCRVVGTGLGWGARNHPWSTGALERFFHRVEEWFHRMELSLQGMDPFFHKDHGRGHKRATAIF